jgi:hypothetical protein
MNTLSTAWKVAASGTRGTRFIGSIPILDKNFNTKQQEKPEYINSFPAISVFAHIFYTYFLLVKKCAIKKKER